MARRGTAFERKTLRPPLLCFLCYIALMLRTHRQASGHSLASLASALGISEPYLSQVERGLRGPLPRKYWATLMGEVPALTLRELEAWADGWLVAVGARELASRRKAWGLSGLPAPFHCVWCGTQTTDVGCPNPACF